ncbi:hypothetical protein FE257_013029 [Aspergillus nanangensis]|uniref:Major facilitator superfamily (MFS) profile domain-containing protein n=1 Tax=Aspergillus nanangensis TaxID=2582783 RepID=A0AAD4GQA3_ASPNN|nr:hypothetical protein FE257_013029 [Aspergillus nanangensis]
MRNRQIETLGRVQLQDETTGAILLVPQPSSDPNDPLNWSNPFKLYVAVLTCAALTWVNFFAAGPSAVLVEIVIDLFGAYPPDPSNAATLTPASKVAFASGVAKAALLFSTASMAAGLSNLLWVPVAVKYGRRLVYTLSFLAFGFCCIWSARATSYGSLLASRIIAAWFAGSAECVAPITIADIFFLHERGRMTAMYSAALSGGAALGPLVSGVMSISQTWRTFHYLCAALVLATTALVFLTMPETAYHRHIDPREEDSHGKEKEPSVSQVERIQISHFPKKKPFTQRMVFNRSLLTQESIWKIALRPVPILLLPPVMWSTVSFGVGIGIFVVMGTTGATAFSQVYRFTVWQVGLVWLGSFVVNLLGMPFGGYFSDWVANRATVKNGGVREPEMRLPAVSIAMVSSAAIGISIVYTIDCYRPIAGEVVVSQVAFKSIITFLMSFYANPWVYRDGYAGAFTAMAALSFVILALWVPLYIWGTQIRHATLNWRVMQVAHWDADRETGE